MMSDMPRPRPPHLHREKNRHKKWVWYVRIGHGPRIRINGEYDSAEFKAEYAAAISGERPKAIAKVRTGSLQWLYDRYRESSAWSGLSVATRRQRENILKRVMEKAGSVPFGDIDSSDIEAGKDDRRDTPAQARNFLDAMRGLFRWAVKQGKHLKIDPTADVSNPRKEATEGFKAWFDEDVEQYKARWPRGTREYVWLYVLRYVGCRRGDAVVLGIQHIRDGVLTYITEKGRTKERIEASIVIDPELQDALAAGPCGDLAFITGERGLPLVKESFGNMFKEACKAAGILDKSAHGVRKLAATSWAERGASENELMAMFGWLTPQMAALYTRKVSRKKLSLNAHARLAGNRAAS